MEITLVGDTALDALLKDYPKRATRATVRAMNRAIASGRTLMVQRIAGDTGLKSGDVRKAMSLRNATAQRLEARLGVGLKRIPLYAFNAKGLFPSRGKGRGVSYRLKGGAGRIANAFIADMKSGHRGVFVRSGKARLPIRELFGPSLGHVFAKYRPEGIERAREMFVTNFRHEMGFEADRVPGAE